MNFKDFIIPLIDKDKEIELNFYSEDDKFIFKLDLSEFEDIKIILKNLINSRPVNVIIINKKSFVENISINPSSQVLLPKFNNAYLQQSAHDDKHPTILTNILDYEKEVDELNGLISITCDQLEYTDGFAKCFDNQYAEKGSNTGNDGKKISYKFNGTRIHIVSFDQSGQYVGGEMEISIDGEVKGHSKPETQTNKFIVVFSSDYLPFGEHTIEIEHVNSDGSTFYVHSLILDPLPKVGGHVLGFNDAREKDASWILDSSSNTSFFKSSKDRASLIFKFHGTRFWLTGIRDDNYGECKLTIDESEPITIDGRKGIDNFYKGSYPDPYNYKHRANGNKRILFYESNVLEFKDHTIKIEKMDSKEFCIINLLYSTQPYNAIIVPKEEITFDEHWILESTGYLTTYNGARASMNGYFNELWIIGNKTPNQQGRMNIYYNDETLENINIDTIITEFTEEILFKNLNNIFRDQYNIEIEKTGSSPEITSESLYISYLYYLNEKTITVEDQSNAITSYQLETNIEGIWKKKDDNIYTEERGASVSAQFFGNKFWIYGTIDPNYGTIDIMFNGQKQNSVSLYNEKRISNVVLYESPDAVSQEEHTIKLINQKKTPISIYQIVYQVLPSTESFTISEDFTNSYSFTKTDQFSRTTDFTRTGDFTKSKQFSETGFFSKTRYFSESTKFSRSEFFSESVKFSRSNYFLKTDNFTKSKEFSSTEYFSESGKFSKTDLFSKSELFSESEKFPKSNYFSKSSDFSKPKQFTETGYFSKTKYFSLTEKFSKSDIFTRSGFFSESGKFSKSNSFSKTNNFTATKDFSRTGLFSRTEHFSLTGKFSATDFFSKSDYFSESGKFTRSNYFSKTAHFSRTEHFSLTSIYTKSYCFSKSDHFLPSDKFSRSKLFTSTDPFTQTNDFSQTKSFSESKKFTQSKGFTQSKRFTQSQDFSESMAFTASALLPDKGNSCLFESQEENYTSQFCNS